MYACKWNYKVKRTPQMKLHGKINRRKWSCVVKCAANIALQGEMYPDKWSDRVKRTAAKGVTR